MAKDIHKSKFDEGTLTKLTILREYLKAWLPVFLKDSKFNYEKIQIYDFFAGEGTDVIGTMGSPLIFLEEMRVYCNSISERKQKVELYFNEYKKDKFQKLQNTIVEFISSCNTSEFCTKTTQSDCAFKTFIENKDFTVMFNELFTEMSRKPQLPRFMFLDQNGIKFIDHDVFSKLISLTRTDFLFFISSAYASRFAELPEFKKYLTVERQDFDESKPYHCHRVILNYYKSLIPQGKEYYLAPFSIKKPNSGNIYGLIFGSNSPLGLEKFLNTAWKLDQHTGEANFDIDNDTIRTGQMSFFAEENVIKKVGYFKKSIVEFLQANPHTNKEIYLFTLESGFTVGHANKILNELQTNNEIKVEFTTSTEKVRKNSFYLKFKPEKEIRISYEKH
jgi:three-Cys-motif partner protein